MLKNGRLCVFPRLLRHYFPPCSLERTRAGTTFAPNSPQSAFHVPCSGFFPGLDAGAFRLFRHALLVARRAERITQQTKERLLRRKTCFPPKPAPCSRPAPYPAPVSCSGSFSHSAPQLWRPGPRTKRRAKGVAPRRRQAWHECAEYRALNRSRPRSPASRMQIRTGRSSPASALSGTTRSAQSRTPAPLAARHRPHPMSIPGRPL